MQKRRFYGIQQREVIILSREMLIWGRRNEIKESEAVEFK